MRKFSILHRAKCCVCKQSKMTVRRQNPYLHELAHIYHKETGLTEEEYVRTLPQENWCKSCYREACMDV